MGDYNDHWCSKCKKELDKTKDKYVEINFLNASKKEAKKEGKHTRVFLCQECLKKEENTTELVENLRKHANPNFQCSILCKSCSNCPNYKYKNAKVNCKYIYIINDKIYCGRRHPGSIRINRDAQMVSNDVESKMQKYFTTILEKGFHLKEGESIPLIQELLAAMGIEPRVVSKLPSNLGKVHDEEIIVDQQLVKKQ